MMGSVYLTDEDKKNIVSALYQSNYRVADLIEIISKSKSILVRW